MKAVQLFSTKIGIESASLFVEDNFTAGSGASNTVTLNGELVLGTASNQTMAGDAETIDTTLPAVAVDPDGASRTGVILESGTTAGQIVYIVNAADANETITFDVIGTSHVAGGTSVNIAQNKGSKFIWMPGPGLSGYAWYVLR